MWFVPSYFPPFWTYIGIAVWAKRLKEGGGLYFVNSYFTVAIYLAVITGILVAVLQWSKSIAIKTRMKRMMVSCGIDEKTAENLDRHLEMDMDAVRSRCRNCPVTDECERWLDGESIASNSFCPNAWHFAKVVGASKTRDSMSAWISE